LEGLAIFLVRLATVVLFTWFALLILRERMVHTNLPVYLAANIGSLIVLADQLRGIKLPADSQARDVVLREGVILVLVQALVASIIAMFALAFAWNHLFAACAGAMAGYSFTRGLIWATRRY